MPLAFFHTFLLLISILFFFLFFIYVFIGSILSPGPPAWGGPTAFLFPSTAIISLSDDNSTFFISRPAAFGPSLPKSGLKGELFVLEEGQLACDDTPGWDPSLSPPSPLSVGDGTDDFADFPESSSASTWKRPASAHADIESLQQSAEIEGKIVLVTRGGCGFLEKVLWAQRRGGVALIVGDYKRPGSGIGSGGLVTMYAKGMRNPRTYVSNREWREPKAPMLINEIGDTSNVTIPSTFTTYTTARLLTSLLPKHVSLPFRQPMLPAPIASPISKENGAGEGEDEVMEHKEKSGGLRIKWPFDRSDDPFEPQPAKLTTLKTTTTTLKRGAVTSTPTRTRTIAPTPTATVVEGTNREGIHVDSSHRPPMSGELNGIVFVVKSDESQSADDDGTEDEKAELDGLWITLTLNTMSRSPFAETLIVLVMSPVFTLLIVYALLCARSVIKRRRWRAPKSVVDRLPVRTYQSTPSTSTPQPPPPPPRSLSLSVPNARERNSSDASSSRGTHIPGVPEKREQQQEYIHRSPPRPQYQGGSVECVVCLEEYIDGVSRVMRLPCGHEFHADCITPWLTTRRRTCPICKGDVVRGAAAAEPTWSRNSDVGEVSERTPLVTG